MKTEGGKAKPILALVLSALAALTGCMDDGESPKVSARRIESRNELPGGPVQYGDPGDFLLENGVIRAVVTDAGHSVNPALWGGSLVDVDFMRPYSEFRAGKGLEQFFLVLPMVNLNVPNPTSGSVRPFVSPEAEAALIRVEGRGDRILVLLNLMDNPAASLMGLKTRFAIATDYVMDEGKSYIKMTTTFRALEEAACADGEDNDNDDAPDCQDPDCSLDPACPTWCADQDCPAGTVCDEFYGGCLSPCMEGACGDGACDSISGYCLPAAVQMEALAQGTDLVDVLAGGFLRFLSGEIDKLTHHSGYVAGDMVLFGDNLNTFVPGIGYEIGLQYRLIFLRGGNPLTSPPSFDFMAGTGDRVSYAYFSLDGAVLFPFSTESLTGSMTHGLNCLRAENDDATCDDVPFVRYDRYMAVGNGDVASLRETMFELREQPYGTVSGQVLTSKSMLPESGAKVFAITDPCVPENCVEPLVDCGPFPTYAELAEAARVCSATPENPDGIGMVASQFTADPGIDLSPTGAFHGPLPLGSYFLVAKPDDGPLSVPGWVEVLEGEDTGMSLLLPPPAVLAFSAIDQAGQPSPVRVTVGHCFNECRVGDDCSAGDICDGEFQCRPPSCATNEECDADEECRGGQCRCRLTRLVGEPWVELGDGYLTDRKVAVEFSLSGQGEIELPDGHYDVIVSRGAEYSIDRFEVQLSAGVTTLVMAKVARVIDSTGWVSVDQHIHSQGSPDSSITHEERLESAITEGMEVLFMTDHDYITDLEPVIREMGLWEHISAWPGEEISTLDIGHHIGFPLTHTTELSNRGAMSWVGRTPNELFSWVRANGSLPPDQTLSVVPHPRGGITAYFDVFALNQYTLELEPGLVQEQSPLLSPEHFSPAFDLMEIMNSKRFDILRTPTYGELIDYQVQRHEVLTKTAGQPVEEVLDSLRTLSATAVRRVLRREEEEQDAVWEFSGEPHCRLPAFCSDLEDCAKGTTCTDGVCLDECEDSAGCDTGLSCDQGVCRMPADYPCDVVRSSTGDWLRMIDRGIFKPGIGGSDVHGLANSEMGSLRNFVRSPTDSPVAVELPTLLGDYRQGRSFATYGPFVELTVDGAGPGETAELDDTGELSIRVQSPLWYDVSRVEILRNGRTEFVFDVDSDDPDFRVEVPNDKIVNVEATLPIAPDEDSWYVAIVMGLEGRSMAPVYGSRELPPVYLGDIFLSVFGALPIELPTYVVPIKLPVYYPQFPVAITNPVFVDVDGVDSSGCAISPAQAPPSWACNYPPDFPKAHIPCVCTE